jgi:peptidoglycan/LPS O-acetylase OafA/YrhL
VLLKVLVNLMQALVVLCTVSLFVCLGFSVYWWYEAFKWNQNGNHTIHQDLATAYFGLAHEAQRNMHPWLLASAGVAVLFAILVWLLVFFIKKRDTARKPRH